jgi:hypothetical protein
MAVARDPLGQHDARLPVVAGVEEDEHPGRATGTAGRWGPRRAPRRVTDDHGHQGRGRWWQDLGECREALHDGVEPHRLAPRFN